MSGISTDQEQQIKELATKGNKIGAIAKYREITGVGLKEAKDAIEAILAGVPASDLAPVQVDEPDPSLEDRIRQLLAERKMIEAIKIYREAYHCGLKEAKDAVDLIQTEMRREEYSMLPSVPAISNDPFAEDTQVTRRRLIILIAVALVALGVFALILVLRNTI